MKINTIIIDDEPKAVSILCNKLERYCPQIDIIATTNDPEKGVYLIDELEPDLVFLDISMPQMNGFEVLQQFVSPQFEVVFATAHDQYAIDAINNSACEYILKPFDNDDLVRVVERALVNINKRRSLEKKKFLLQNLKVIGHERPRIIIPNREGFEFVRTREIIHCEGVEGYTKVHLSTGKVILSSQSIGNFVKLLPAQYFFQVHKSHIINIECIVQYLNEGYFILENAARVPLSRQRKEAFFEALNLNNTKKDQGI